MGNRPTSIALGEGAVWVSNRDDGTVSRIDPGTDSVTDTVRVGGSPEAIAAGEGSIWVADTAGGTVVRINPRARRVSDRISVESSPVALLVAQGSVWASARAPQASHRGGTLRFATRPFEFCRCIDSAGYEGRNVPLLSLVYDGLVAYRRVGGAAGNALVPDLARTVPKPIDGGRTFVFQLRRGPRFSNGAPVRPDDFRATIERVLRLAPQAPPFYRGIVGADRCTPRRCDLSEGIRIDAAARTVTVRLREPDPEFLHKLALPLAYVVPADSPLELARERPLLGTGPYRFARFDPERGGRLVRNPRFRSWSAEARLDGFPDEVTFSIRSDPAAQVAAVRGGTADVLPVAGTSGADVPPDQIRDLTLADISSVRSAPTLTTDMLFLNTREAPFDDVRVRRALNLAIDRRRIVELIGGPAVASPTCQIIPPGLPGYRPRCPQELAESGMSRARRLVDRSGTGGARVTVWSFEGPPADIARYTRGVLGRLGYTARVRIAADVGAHFAQVADSRTAAQVGVTGWVADFLSPSSFFGPLFSCRQLAPRSPANTNLSQFCDPAADDLLRRAVGAGGAEAAGLWSALDRRIARAAPSVPLYNRREMLLVSGRVGNVQQHIYLGSLLDQFWVRRTSRTCITANACSSRPSSRSPAAPARCIPPSRQERATVGRPARTVR
ncbi:MAG: ABC transporter substrate-binding protein [Thermoleophilaceae bacterium]